MAAPSGTVWGDIAGSYGRIGLYVSLTTTNTTVTATVQVWFWSKYSVSDTSNTLYFNDNATSATTSKGAVSVKTTVASGSGWSTSNQVKLGTFTCSTVTRGTSAVTRNCAAKLTNIDRVGSTMTVNTSYTVPAKPSYTVSYNANGGSGAPSSQKKWYGTTLTLSSTKPTRTGYTFEGWATSASSSTVAYAAGASYTANAAITLYAVWKIITYTVTYNANGGSGAPSSQTKNYGTAITLSSTKPTRTNYTFQGWATSSTGSVVYAAGGTYSNNASITLYAVWTLAYVKPTIRVTSCNRCTSSGTLDEEGTYAKIVYSWIADQTVGSNPGKTIKITGTGTDATVTLSGTSGSGSYIVGGGSLSTESQYTYTLVVTDSTGGTGTTTTTVSTTRYAIDTIGGSIPGVAIGKVATKTNLFDVALPAIFNSTIEAAGKITTSGMVEAEKNIFTRGNNLLFHYLSSNTDNAGMYYGHCYSSGTLAHFGLTQINSDGTNEWTPTGLYVYPAYNHLTGNTTTSGMVKSTYAPGTDTAASDSSFLATHGTADSKVAYTAIRTDTKMGVSLQVGSGGSNRGVYDETNSGWILYAGSTGAVYVGNNKLTNTLYLCTSNGVYINTNATSSDKYSFRVNSTSADGGLYLGTGSYRWATIYSTTSSISTSDRNEKKDFCEYDDRFDTLFDDLKPQRYKYKDNDSNRYHSGFISQDVEASLLKSDLTALDFAGFCKDGLLKDGLDKDFAESEDDYKLDENGNKIYRYSLRYEEFISLNTWQIQKLKSRVTELENKINEII